MRAWATRTTTPKTARVVHWEGSMTTERKNAGHSTGPRAPHCNAIASRNNTCHGIDAPCQHRSAAPHPQPPLPR